MDSHVGEYLPTLAGQLVPTSASVGKPLTEAYDYGAQGFHMSLRYADMPFADAELLKRGESLAEAAVPFSWPLCRDSFRGVLVAG